MLGSPRGGDVELRPILPSSSSGAGSSFGAGAGTGAGGSGASASRQSKPVSLSDADTELDVHETAHRVHCGGRCVTGPPEDGCDIQQAFLWVYVAVILAYCSLAGFLLFEHFPALAAMPLAFLLLDVLAFLLCGCTDAGVVPPRPDLGVTPDASRRWCHKCHMYQDEAEHGVEVRHCRTCDACCRELDHHCGVTGNCVGARNKVHFCMLFHFYIMSMFGLLVGAVYVAIVAVVSRRSDFDGTFSDGVTVSAHAFTGVFAAIIVASLAFWVLAYYDHLGQCGACAFRTFCCQPDARLGTSLLMTDVEREPACGRATPCPGGTCTAPKRDFYP